LKVSNSVLKVKRSLKKVLSQNTAIKIKTFVENNCPEDEMMIRKMIRQIMCAVRLEVYDNDIVKSYFCREKTCLVCNSIRLAKFLDKYLDKIKAEEKLYHMVLTVKNPVANSLKDTIDKMYSFFQNSMIKKDKRYKELNKEIKFIRSFEATLKEETKTFHIHFHILLGGKLEEEVKEYGNIMISYWLKYFGEEKANIKGQYLEEQTRSILENFKYLFKINDISDSNIKMVYQLLIATAGRRLFTAKGFPYEKKITDMLKEVEYNDIEEAKLISTFHYKKDCKNWINPDTGELFVNDDDVNKYKNDQEEKRNFNELVLFFREKAKIKVDSTRML
jgi:hypothetical protein